MREGRKVATAKGRPGGKQLELTPPPQEAYLVELRRSTLWRAGTYTSDELADLFSAAGSTVYRAVRRAGEPVRAKRSMSG